jgi:hypothetical protein
LTDTVAGPGQSHRPVLAHMHSALYLLPLVYSQINPNKVQILEFCSNSNKLK